ncbi:MAG: pyridoxamine 5'-phosphate oxidase family protein [Flavobacterium sp.]|nr:pyridoxamine 5'-phosphate oxidase family protein [Flavobacterium sp.]
MTNIENLENKEGIEKLKKLVDEIKFCFFKTNPENHNIESSTIMTAQNVDKDGNIWFFSGIDSDRNRDIKTNQKVELYFSCPEKNAYLSVNAEAHIVLDKEKMKELWNPLLKIWFKDGVDDQNISLIMAKTKTANYWDSEGGKMINFIKMIAAAITGTDNIDTTQGKIKL